MQAVDDVSFAVAEGETLGLVGESGCGKSTLARSILQLIRPTSGSVRFRGTELTDLGRRQLRPLRREMQMIFQDPYASLNPRKRVGQIVGDPLKLHGVASGDELQAAASRSCSSGSGSRAEHYNRFPHEFSGGQRQRIGVARALALEPKMIIADEPVSALDVSIQAQIINLLEDLQDEFELTYVFVAHDLGVVRHVSDRIAVMYLGKIVEIGPAEDVYSNPIHPYTVSLLSAVPIPDPRLNEAREHVVLEGDVPSPANPPPACRFHTRCPRATEICSEVEPQLVDYGSGPLGGLPPPGRAQRARDRDRLGRSGSRRCRAPSVGLRRRPAGHAATWRCARRTPPSRCSRRRRPRCRRRHAAIRRFQVSSSVIE